MTRALSPPRGGPLSDPTQPMGSGQPRGLVLGKSEGHSACCVVAPCRGGEEPRGRAGPGPPWGPRSPQPAPCWTQAGEALSRGWEPGWACPQGGAARRCPAGKSHPATMPCCLLLRPRPCAARGPVAAVCFPVVVSLCA